MTILTPKDLRKMEENYYWAGYKEWSPFPIELKVKLLKAFGKEPYPYTWTEQDIHEGSRKIIFKYFKV